VIQRAEHRTVDANGAAARPGALVVSLDFELHWGVRDRLTTDAYRANLLGARDAVPAMLRLFTEFGVHATWATVGLLFFESKRAMLDGIPARRPAYAHRGLSPYDALDEVGRDEEDDPFHFAPSLIRQIAATPHQEIGTHTFSHYYCLEPGQSPEDFRDDLAAAVEVARRTVGETPSSIAFPRNQYAEPYLTVCRESGLDAYRGSCDAWAYRPRGVEEERLLRRGLRLADAYLPLVDARPRPRRDAGDCPTDVPGSRYLRPYSAVLRHLEPLRLRRIETDLTRAAFERRRFHLWWHPHDFGRHLAENLANLRRLLAHFARLRDAYGMESLTMAEARNGERTIA
jgi:peptidoglycan/xylan/chitin deacetylase (PgdA/CDA1 family)